MSDDDKPTMELPGLPVRPTSAEVDELLAPPKARVDEVRPIPVQRAGRLLIDYNPQPLSQATPGLPNVWRIEAPMSGLAFGGVVPWNVVAFVVPIDAVAQLQASQAQLFAISEAVTMDAAISGFRGVAGVDAYWIMRPGEAVDFGRPVAGVAGFFAAPWSGLYPFGQGQDGTKTANSILNSYLLNNLAAGVAANTTAGQARCYKSSWDPQLPISGSQFAPVLRALQRTTKPVTLPWQNSAWVIPNVLCTKSNGAVCIPTGARYVTLQFATPPNNNCQPAYDVNNAPYGYDGYFRAGAALKLGASGQNATPYDFVVEWIGHDGLFHLHPADQLIASARGQVGPSHDIEIFEIPRSAAGLCLSPGAANPFGSWPQQVMCTYAFSGALTSA